jgi:MFS family permease
VGYDTSVIGGTMALDSFKRDFGLDIEDQDTIDTLLGNVVSTFQAGAFFGSLLSFPLAEKIGRKKSIMIASVVFLVGGSFMVRISSKIMCCMVLTSQDCGQWPYSPDHHG